MAGDTRAPVDEGKVTLGGTAVVACWMCGIRLNQDQMIPDGTGACNDVRWYCQDTWACTERWTAVRRQMPSVAEVDDVGAMEHRTQVTG